MARSTKSSSSHPMKRRRDDDDGNSVNPKKKIKRDFSEWTESNSETSSGSSSASLSIEILSPKDGYSQSKKRKIREAMALIAEVLQCGTSSSFQKELVDELGAMIRKTERISEEMEFRKKAISHKYNDDELIGQFANRMIKGYRWKDTEEIVEYGPGAPDKFIIYDLDFAMKSIKPHPKYAEKMHSLLKKHINDKNVVDVVIGYCQNGYRWYRMSLYTDVSDHSEGECFEALNDEGILSALTYEDDDYFRDAEYCDNANTARRSHALKFEEWRRDLDSKYMDCMSDEDLAKFVMLVDRIHLNSHLEGEDWENSMVNWIVRKHT